MEKLNIIRKVDEPTEWVNSMVVVPKANRICLDPRDLNRAIKREHYQMPTLDEVTCQLAGAKYFTVFRCNVRLLGRPALLRVISVDNLPIPVWKILLFTNTIWDMFRAGSFPKKDGQFIW